jgi:hypothetical protein
MDVSFCLFEHLIMIIFVDVVDVFLLPFQMMLPYFCVMLGEINGQKEERKQKMGKKEKGEKQTLGVSLPSR